VLEVNMFDLSGKVGVITGSTRGIGRAIAEQMALHGAKIVVSGRDGGVCEKVADEINEMVRKGAGEAAAVPCNISRKDQLKNLVDQALLRHGRIDILVCNAAVNVYFGPSAGIPDEIFDKTLHANVRSNHWLCQMVLPGMVERKQGVIIMVSSISALRGSSVLGTYGITKAAEIAMVRNIAVEYGPKNIRANAILPGLIQTDFSRALWENEEFLRERIKATPLRRIGEPNDIAGAAVFLASDAGSFMTGQTLVIDGGVTA
jgi:NAD(P)-dependent dehydrogenase (short-subunit alcohol dehydrogenase family)